MNGIQHATVSDIQAPADALRSSGQSRQAGELLTAAARRALRGTWRPDERTALAAAVRDHQQFDQARRLLARVRDDGPDSEALRQQHALCTYKDIELPALRLGDSTG